MYLLVTQLFAFVHSNKLTSHFQVTLTLEGALKRMIDCQFTRFIKRWCVVLLLMH